MMMARLSTRVWRLPPTRRFCTLLPEKPAGANGGKIFVASFLGCFAGVTAYKFSEHYLESAPYQSGSPQPNSSTEGDEAGPTLQAELEAHLAQTERLLGRYTHERDAQEREVARQTQHAAEMDGKNAELQRRVEYILSAFTSDRDHQTDTIVHLSTERDALVQHVAELEAEGAQRTEQLEAVRGELATTSDMKMGLEEELRVANSRLVTRWPTPAALGIGFLAGALSTVALIVVKSQR